MAPMRRQRRLCASPIIDVGWQGAGKSCKKAHLATVTTGTSSATAETRTFAPPRSTGGGAKRERAVSLSRAFHIEDAFTE